MLEREALSAWQIQLGAAVNKERARIRRELLEEIKDVEQLWEGCREAIEKSDLIAILDRICPEEER